MAVQCQVSLPAAIASLLRLFFSSLEEFPLLSLSFSLREREKTEEFLAKCERKEASAAGENCQTVVTSAPVCR